MFKFGDIVLRKLAREDLPQLLLLKSESWETTHHITIVHMEDQSRWFDSLDKDVHTPKNLIMMAHCPSLHQDAFGVYKITNIDWNNRTASAAWDVFAQYRGKKLGKPLVAAGTAFCVDILNLRRIECEILENNIASQKCAEASRFQKEGVKRQAILKKGVCLDSFVYGVLSQDLT